MSAPGKAEREDCDFVLDQAIEELRGYCRRLHHGRVHLVLERERGSTSDYRLAREPLTTRDVERLMTRLPRGRKEDSA